MKKLNLLGLGHSSEVSGEPSSQDANKSIGLLSKLTSLNSVKASLLIGGLSLFSGCTNLSNGVIPKPYDAQLASQNRSSDICIKPNPGTPYRIDVHTSDGGDLGSLSEVELAYLTQGLEEFSGIKSLDFRGHALSSVVDRHNGVGVLYLTAYGQDRLSNVPGYGSFGVHEYLAGSSVKFFVRTSDISLPRYLEMSERYLKDSEKYKEHLKKEGMYDPSFSGDILGTPSGAPFLTRDLALIELKKDLLKKLKERSQGMCKSE